MYYTLKTVGFAKGILNLFRLKSIYAKIYNVVRKWRKIMKNINKALITSAVLTLAGAVVNIAAYLSGRIIPLAYTLYGGECIIDTGFGIRVTHIYSMTQGGGSSVNAGVAPVSLIVCFAGIFVIVFAVLKIIGYVKGNHERS